MSYRLAAIRRNNAFLPIDLRLYKALVLPHLDYCSVLWHECGSVVTQKIERIQNYAFRIITSSPSRTPSDDFRRQLNWQTLQFRSVNFRWSLVHKCILGLTPTYEVSKFQQNKSLGYCWTRGYNHIRVNNPRIPQVIRIQRGNWLEYVTPRYHKY